jgi:hypothetical protein
MASVKVGSYIATRQDAIVCLVTIKLKSVEHNLAHSEHFSWVGSGRVASYRYKLVSRRLYDSVLEASGQSEASKRNIQDQLGRSSARADSRLIVYSDATRPMAAPDIFRPGYS